MKRLFYATLFSVVTLFGMSAQANLQPLVVVKLNGYETISLKDLKDSVETYQSQSGQKFNIEQKKEILVLIWERIVDVKIPGRQGAARYFSILLMALFWSLRFWH